MGAGESKSSEAFHVLMIQDNSPAAEAGLEPFFDYIVAINGIRLNQEDTTLVDVLKNNMNKDCKITVYSSKTQEMRDLTIVPNNNWGGVGLLGARIRYCSFEGASENVWHVLSVAPNSPADKAGLKENTDYIIATPDTLLHDQASFSELVEQSLDKDLRLYVYNTVTDKTREVSLTPTKSWGGKGSLGCDVGYGYLHQIPKTGSSGGSPSANQANDQADSHDHDHGHSHSHDHGHSHSHGHNHSHSHSHGGDDDSDDDDGHDHGHSHDGSHGHSHSHGQADGYAEVPLVGAPANSN